MRSKILSKRTLVIIAFSGLMFPVVLFVYGTPQNLIRGSSVPLSASTAALYGHEQNRSGLPLRLTIPSIGVDAYVEYVGVAPDGTMDVPKEPANVGWFNRGSRPGENGSAVIAGHYGWKDGTSAVFDDLYKVRPGDKIYTEDENGEVVTFVVRESRSYDPDADASDVFGSSDGEVHLNLITCEGVWDSVSKTYSKRLVVFTDKE